MDELEWAELRLVALSHVLRVGAAEDGVEEPAIDVAIRGLAGLAVGRIVARRVVGREVGSKADPTVESGPPVLVDGVAVSEQKMMEHRHLAENVAPIPRRVKPV